MNSDDSLCILRGFGQLHCRLLVQRQLEIHDLEQELKDLDALDNQTSDTRYRLQSVKHEEHWDSRQRDLMDKISTKLREYGKASPRLFFKPDLF